ncbi:MAG: ATP-dependent DNA helicase RecG [gamma proteobacterium symbiont of Bathyaustriella thionipta]|nr:ATP-dependent DNA helicase RecG [gamma proteobacterium symbiont of Bathyaustriella thionipta]MCU7949971.1 ATP-dependent DNA helicase RecG [gamma proteobacterium symbiont of Bathyaustriella thionipta]MCU7954779.1 ATP-dependent DNA helicase RecG [gamma proteobacterium symbiont of Bathyaustriella thionipta]MCU7956549.1 ATP-dependent DNA helicase RecG [gamma proteobacterium symbiont of Bathyaustriella thionipta]MCU7966544.1 ATP-dependent DNA helicase RecG [gamma proteobacterium symbiont of Bathy
MTLHEKQNTTGAHWLEQSIIVLKGVGEKMLERFAKRSLFTLNDLLFHLPVRYQDKTRVVPISTLRVGDSALVSGELIQCKTHTARRAVLTCEINDGSGVISLRFFHFNKQQASALTRALEQGKWLKCFGDIKRGRQSLEITHPEYRIIDQHQPIQLDETLTPIYPTTEGLSQLALRNAIQQVLQRLKQQIQQQAKVDEATVSKEHALVSDYLPLTIRQELQLPSLIDALLYLHSPPPDCPVFELIEGNDPYRQSLVFEELLAHQLTMKRAYQNQMQHYSYPLITSNKTEKLQYSAQFLKQLPFKLTKAQLRVIAEIETDVSQSHPMQRLVQGDVGSGKTAVAAMSALLAIENGFQVALMAPTELLAEQHRNNFQQWLQPLGLNVAWLSGKCKAKERREALESIADGSAQMIIGTHALFQTEVNFHQLGLVIIDEQHRFGVHQRLALLQKGKKEKGINQEMEQSNKQNEYDYYPHQLIMTATPIPRTLAMTAYADLDCSVIDELPPGRTPVETVVLGEQRRDDILQRVHQACLNGRQAYWVCTLIEESEILQCQAAEKTYELLQNQFPDLSIGLVHGRMKADEKLAVMHSFKQGEILLLVATTVIEVGVDVPNASLMIIENAERLCLSQLHQLRGRVGRGSQSSACVLMYGSPLSRNGKARLMTLRATNDGFEVARKDLALRGPGEVMGTRQTGLAEMKIADIIRDQDLIPEINTLAQRLINDYPETVDPIINRWIGQKMEYQNV